MSGYLEYAGAASAFLLAFIASAFGYGKLNQKVDNLVLNVDKDITAVKKNVDKDIITIKKNFTDFIENNKTEHEVMFATFTKVTKHMGAVEQYMKMEEARKRNGGG